MAVYAYKALDDRRASVSGTVAADSPRQAREVLRQRGLSIRELAAETAGPPSGFSRSRRRPSTAQVTTVLRDLATLLGAGIPLADALGTLLERLSGPMARSLLLLQERVGAGIGLAAAMEEQPHVFDELTRQMVEVGERSGDLDRVLEQLADFKERSSQLRDRVWSALLYPVIVLTVSLAVTLFLMTCVVPMILDNLIESGKPLPWPTRVVKTLSDGVTRHGIWLLPIAAGLVAAAVIVPRTPRGREAWHRLLLRLPLFGEMARRQGVARIALVTATLLRSGIVLLTALEMAVKSTSNVVLAGALRRAGEAIRAGRDLAQALKQDDCFPPLVVQIFAVGQQSGKLETMLERLAHDYDRQVASLASRLATVMEPILILFLAVIVGFILFATILPILEAGHAL
jgi:general secretion pathway protein F